MAYFAIFTSCFLSFFVLKYLHCFILKDIYWKYILIDSSILSLYFWILFSAINYYGDTIPDHIFILTYFLIWMVTIPSLYSIIKKHFIMDHPKIATWHYPIFEFLIFIFGMALSMWIPSLFIYLFLMTN